MPKRFRDRVEAGRLLGELLARTLTGPSIVLAIPRAGVQVGAPVAVALHAPLVPLLVRKLGLPERPELVVGAIDADGALIARASQSELGLLPSELEGLGEDVARRLRAWRDYFGAPDPASLLPGHSAVIVDDALLTGLTMHAGVEYMRRRGAERILVAVPCGVEAAAARLRDAGAEVVMMRTVKDAAAVPSCYEHLPDVTAEEVAQLLARGGPSRPPSLRMTAPPERELRLVDAQGSSHRAQLHLPSGLGVAPAALFVGSGLAPNRALGDRLARALAEAGIASLRLAADPIESALVHTALDVLASREEIDPLRLAVVAWGDAVSVLDAASRDQRLVALAALPGEATLPKLSELIVARGDAISAEMLDAFARILTTKIFGDAR